MLRRPQRLAVAHGLGAEALGAVALRRPQRIQPRPIRVGAGTVQKPGRPAAAPVQDALEGTREQLTEGPALDHQVHPAEKPPERLARGMVDQVRGEDPVDEPHGFGVLESGPGDVCAPDLEPPGPHVPGREEFGVRLPARPAIARLPPPIGVPGIELPHGDAMAKHRPDGAVAAGEVEHPQRVARIPGGAHRAMDCLQRTCEHFRHAVFGRPQRVEVGTRIIEVVDAAEVVLVPRETAVRSVHVRLKAPCHAGVRRQVSPRLMRRIKSGGPSAGRPHRGGAGAESALRDRPRPRSPPDRRATLAGARTTGSDGGQGRNRTADTRIFSPLLYRLSYLAAGAY